MENDLVDSSSAAKMEVWEGSKENVIPLKKGRKLEGMALSTFPSKEEKRLKENGERLFEDRILEAGEDFSKKLDIFVEYYTWVRRTTSNNLTAAKTILEVSVC